MPNQRHTLQRQLILLSVKSSGRFITAEDVFRSVKKRCPSVGLATVYRNLETLRRTGAIFAFEGQDGVRRYAGHVFHDAEFVCESCGRTLDVSLGNVTTQLKGALSGTRIFFSRLDVRGLCRSCSRKQAKQMKGMVA